MTDLSEYKDCPRCGKPAKVNATVCGYCWTKLAATSHYVPGGETQSIVSSRGSDAAGEQSHSIASPIGGVISAICSFMPWVSCMGQEASGADAGGILWLVFFAALGIVGAFFHFRSKGRLHKAKAPVVACAGLGIAILLLRYFALLNSEESELVSIRFGSVATLVGFIAAIYGTTHFPRDEGA